MGMNYDISLSREVKTERSLPPLARLLYGDICAIVKNHGECTVTNRVWAKEYGVSLKTISRHIAALVKARYIRTEMALDYYGNYFRYIIPLKTHDAGGGEKEY